MNFSCNFIYEVIPVVAVFAVREEFGCDIGIIYVSIGAVVAIAIA